MPSRGVRFLLNNHLSRISIKIFDRANLNDNYCSEGEGDNGLNEIDSAPELSLDEGDVAEEESEYV